MTRETHTLAITVTTDGSHEQFSTDDMADHIRDRVFEALRDYEQYVQNAGTTNLDDPTFEIVVMEVNPLRHPAKESEVVRPL